MRKDEVEKLHELCLTIECLERAVAKLIDSVDRLQRQNVPELLQPGTYKAKIVETVRKDGRTAPYWTVELEVEDYPGKKLWANFSTKCMWRAVRVGEELGITVHEGPDWFSHMMHMMVGKECKVQVGVEAHYSFSDRKVNRVEGIFKP